MSFEDVWELPWPDLRREEVKEASHAVASLGGMSVAFDVEDEEDLEDEDDAAEDFESKDEDADDADADFESEDDDEDDGDVEEEDDGNLQVVFEFKRDAIFEVVHKLNPDRYEWEDPDLQQELDDLKEWDDQNAPDTFAIGIEFWDADDDDTPRMELYSNHFNNRDVWGAAHTIFRILGERLGAEPRQEPDDMEVAEELAPRIEKCLDALRERSELPLFALRNKVLFPYGIQDRDVGRSESIAAMLAAKESTPVLLAVFAQRDAGTEDPQLDDLCSVGCAAEIALIEKYAEDNYNIGVIGLARIRVTGTRDAGGYTSVAFEVIEEPAPGKTKGLLKRIFGGGGDVGAQLDTIADELRAIMKDLDAAMAFFPSEDLSFDEIEEPGRLADLCANQLSDWDNEAEVQAVMETIEIEPRLRKVLEIAQARQANHGSLADS